MRIGALFAGMGGLDIAVREVLGGELAWVSEIERGACRILEHRFPGVPNIGDITAADWAAVEPVEVLTGGSPCQDLSTAGKRAGMTTGTRSNLWVAMREAIAMLRPRLVVWENVRGAYSAPADSAMERDPRRLGDDPGRPVLRALGRVLGDLADLGYDARWHGLRAADVGAPHERFRVFLIAHPVGAELPEPRPGGGLSPSRLDGLLLSTPAVNDMGEGKSLDQWADWTERRRAQGRHDHGSLAIDTPDVSSGRRSEDSHARGDHQTSIYDVPHLLPTPAVNDMGAGKEPEWWDAWTDEQRTKHDNGNDHGPSLSIEARRLPTPRVYIRDLADASVADWGPYAAAVARWEALTRPAPAPTILNEMTGRAELNPELPEWMMGLPAGWVTDPAIWAGYTDRNGKPASPGYIRKAQLHSLGNGVCPPQAAAALRALLSLRVEVAS